MNIHIKRFETHACLTLRNDAGRTFTTTLNRGIEKNDPRVLEMARRFEQGKKLIDPTPIARVKTGVGIKNVKQGVLV